jgi:Domain of unknown function (DUF4265)
VSISKPYPGRDRVKVHFDLDQDEDGFPPVHSEGLWAIRLNDERYELDNIPFFVSGVSCCDVITVRESPEGYYTFDRLVEERGHSTLRVIFSEGSEDCRPLLERARDLREILRKQGCSVELSDDPLVIAVDVPPDVSLTPVRDILDTGEERGLWGYEEATVAHTA